MLSGELHYARIPREYWHARLKMARAMGLNTIATYVFWNVHEPTPGQYDFTGQNDVAAFIKAAQEEGLYVILRSGPYACAEWDFGGFPCLAAQGRLRSPPGHPHQRSRLHGPRRALDQRASPRKSLPLQIGRGGPILMTQIENEYGSSATTTRLHAHAHARHLRQASASPTPSSTPPTTGDEHPRRLHPRRLRRRSTSASVNHQTAWTTSQACAPGQPLFVSEYWPGWFDHWGHPHETRPIAPQIEDIDYILNRGAGINIYMFQAAPASASWRGASYINDKFLPDVTSYDYDAPLDESGRPTPKYFAYRKELAKWSACGNESCLPPVPAGCRRSIAIPTDPTHDESHITLAESASQSRSPVHCRPRWRASARTSATSSTAPNYPAGSAVTCTSRTCMTSPRSTSTAGWSARRSTWNLDRRNAEPDGTLPPIPITTTGPARLDIFVANDGRVNVDTTMRTESKGITTVRRPRRRARYRTGRYTPCRWSNSTSLQPYRGSPAGFAIFLGRRLSRFPSDPPFYRAHFYLTATGDTFLDIRKLGKGAIWINGHNLGRFWNIGPQDTLYLPGPWLKTGKNEIVVFDMLPTGHESVTGLDHPILDGPVRDKTTGNQE